MKLVGGGKRSIIIQFVSDTDRASRNIDNLVKKIDRARQAASRPFDRDRFGKIFSQPISIMSSREPDRSWYNVPGLASRPGIGGRERFHSPLQKWLERTGAPVKNIDRNLEFLAKRRGELGIGMRTPRYMGDTWQKWLYSSGATKHLEELRGARGLFGKFKGLGGKITTAIGRFTGLNSSILSILGKFGKLGLLIGAAVVSFKRIIHHGNLIEGNLIQMEVLLGNQRRANDMMREAIRYSMLTPFSPEETFGAVTASLQYNIDPFRKGAYGLGQNQNVMQILSGLGSFRDIRGQALGVERAAHAVMRGDYRLLRPYRGIVQPAFETAKKVGQVGTPAFTQTFIRELGKIPQIMAMAERHSNSVAGMWSTIKGFAEEFWISVSGAGEMEGVVTFWSQLKSIVRDIRDAGIQMMDYLKPGLTEIGSALGSIFKFVWDIFKRIGEILGPILIPALKLMWEIFRLIFVGVEQVLYFVMWIIRVVVKFVSIFVSYIDKLTGISDKIKAMTNWMVDFIAGMKAAFELDKIYLEWLVDNIGVKYEAFVSRILGKLREVWNFLKRFYSEHHRIIDFFLTFGMSEALPTNQNRSILGNVSNAAGVVAQGAGEIKKLVQSNTTGGRVARAVLSAGMTEVLPGVPRPVQNNPQNTTNNTNINVTNNQAAKTDIGDLTRVINGLMLKTAVPRGPRD